MDRFHVRGEAADSVAEYLRYHQIVGDADGGIPFTDTEFAAFKSKRGIVDEGSARAVETSQQSEKDVMEIYEQRYQARRKGETARLKPGEAPSKKYAIALNMPPMHMIDALARADDDRPQMPWDLPCDDPPRLRPAASNRGRLPLATPPQTRGPPRVGDAVEIVGKKGMACQRGMLRFVGTTHFGKSGEVWMGVELDQPDGKNAGIVEGQRYFDCRPDHGLFVKPSRVEAAPPS